MNGNWVLLLVQIQYIVVFVLEYNACNWLGQLDIIPEISHLLNGLAQFVFERLYR